MDDYKFYLQVKSIVERIFIYQNQSYINEMQYATSNIDKIFNGVIPTALKKQKLILKFVGMPNEISYNFNNVFSKPIDHKLLLTMDVDNYIQKNIIIINTPKMIEQVIINVPAELQKLLKLPPLIFTTDVDKNKLDLRSNLTELEMLNKGIDPNSKQFI